MSEDRKKILEMLADKKISVEEAEKLLAALAGGSQPGDGPSPADAGTGSTCASSSSPVPGAKQTSVSTSACPSSSSGPG